MLSKLDTISRRSEVCDSKRIRIAIVDDHPLMRAGLQATLQAAPDFELVGVGGTADHALEIAATALPEVMFIDLSLPGDGIEAIRRLSMEFPAVKAIVLTVHEDAHSVKRAFFAGASGFLHKGIGAEQLLDHTRAIAAGEFQVPPTVAEGLLGNSPSGPGVVMGIPFELTRREREILLGLAGGKTNREIGQSLALSEKTIRNYLTNIFRKLNLRSRVEAALLAASRKT